MKEKRPPVGRNDVSYMGGMAMGGVIFQLMWWLATGFQHPPLVFGGGALLLFISAGNAYVSRKARKGGRAR